MDFCVFSTIAVTAFASGALLTTQSWSLLDMGLLVQLSLVAAAMFWLWRRTAVKAALA